jgi:hypothetical protein
LLGDHWTRQDLGTTDGIYLDRKAGSACRIDGGDLSQRW